MTKMSNFNDALNKGIELLKTNQFSVAEIVLKVLEDFKLSLYEVLEIKDKLYAMDNYSKNKEDSYD